MIGQRCVQQQIKGAIENNDLARFSILVGDIGSGRKTLAKEIAKWVGAECVIVDKGVDAVRDVIVQSYKMSEPVLYVLDNDGMSQAAKSALLKVTEEPPNKAMFVLTVTDLSQTLDTLTSRARIYRMDGYTPEDIAQFAGTEDRRFTNFCTNKYEVDLLKSYGIDNFADFIALVVDNIDEVSGANALKMENRLSFAADDGKYDIKIFLQAFRTECVSRMLEVKDVDEKLKYIEWVNITTNTLSKLKISSLNRQSLLDMWIFDIRGVQNADS